MKGKVMDKYAAWERELHSLNAVPVSLSVEFGDGKVQTFSNVDSRSIAFQQVHVVDRDDDGVEDVLCLTFETCDSLNPVIYTVPNVSYWSSVAE